MWQNLNPIHDKNAQESRDRNTGWGSTTPIHFFFLKKKRLHLQAENERCHLQNELLQPWAGPLSSGVPGHKNKQRSAVGSPPASSSATRTPVPELAVPHPIFRPFACRSSCQGLLTTPLPRNFLFNIQAQLRLTSHSQGARRGSPSPFHTDSTGSHPHSLSSSLLFFLTFIPLKGLVYGLSYDYRSVNLFKWLVYLQDVPNQSVRPG